MCVGVDKTVEESVAEIRSMMRLGRKAGGWVVSIKEEEKKKECGGCRR